MIGRNKDDVGMKLLVSASQIIHMYKGNERTSEHAACFKVEASSWNVGPPIHEQGRTNMDKHQLAQELRQRQYARGLVKKQYIDALSDHAIIESYSTCSGCGAKFVPLDNLDLLIKRARSAEQFIAAIALHTH